MPFLVTFGTLHGTRQWWQRPDRETLYRTRRDAIHARRGVSLLSVLNRGRWPRTRTITKLRSLGGGGFQVVEELIHAG